MCWVTVRFRGPGSPQQSRLAFRTWNIAFLVRKKPATVHEVERYRLDIVGITSTYSLDSGTSSQRGAGFCFRLEFPLVIGLKVTLTNLQATQEGEAVISYLLNL